VTITRNLDGNPITWTYDDLYRLTGQQKAGQVCTYTLDGVGNLKTMWEGGAFPRTFTFNAADRLVTMVEGASLTTYAWTGYGALESEITGNSTTGYAYSGQDQLAVVTAPTGDKTTYSFDGDGLRRSVAITNVNQDPPTLDVTTMVWDGSDYLLLNEPTGNRVVLTLDSEIVSCGTKDLLTDPLGSLVKEISAGASLGSLVELYPYGTRASALTKISIPFVYIAAYGYYNDSAERDYVRARELMKKTGRWMQVSVVWPDELACQYALASPIARIDPSGAFPAPVLLPLAPINYGNYCGFRAPLAPCKAAGLPPPNPIDCLDRCCRNHDWAWWQYHCGSRAHWFDYRCQRSNARFCECAANVNCRTDVDPSNYRDCVLQQAGIALFCKALPKVGPPPPWPPIVGAPPPIFSPPGGCTGP
jgi:YD repeat-containing protein